MSCLLLVPSALPARAGAIGFIKGSSSTVYWVGNDGKRYVFPNGGTYQSWFFNGQNTDYGITILGDGQLSQYPLGGNVTYRPGVRLVKIQTDPKVYAVARGGVLRWVTSEALAAQLYGSNWNRQVDDIPVEFFVNYTLGNAITDASQFSPSAEYTAIINPDDDRRAKQGIVPPQQPTPTPAPSSTMPSVSAAITNRSVSNGVETVTYVATLSGVSDPSLGEIRIYDNRSSQQLAKCLGVTQCVLQLSSQYVIDRTLLTNVFWLQPTVISSGELTVRFGTVAASPFTGNLRWSYAPATVYAGDDVTLTGTLENASAAVQDVTMEINDGIGEMANTTHCLGFTCSRLIHTSGVGNYTYYIRAKNTQGSVIDSGYINIPVVARPISQAFNATVTMTADQTAIYPPTEPTSITFRTTVTNATIPTSDLRIDIYNAGGAFQKTCTGVAVCDYTLGYRIVVNDADEQYYAIVSNPQGVALPRAYSPVVLVRPRYLVTTLNSSAASTLQAGYSVVLTGKLVLPYGTDLSTLTTSIIDRRDGQVIKTCYATDICNADAYPVYRPGGNNTIYWSISASDQYGRVVTQADSLSTVITPAP